MSTPPGPVRRLPPVPNLEQQKKLARELLRAAQAGDAAALARFRVHHPRFGAVAGTERLRAQLKLHAAQRPGARVRLRELAQAKDA